MRDQTRRRAANALIGAGFLLILLVAGYFGLSRVSADRLRAELRAAPVAAAAAPLTEAAKPAAVSTPVPVPPTRAPTVENLSAGGAAQTAPLLAPTATRSPTRRPTQAATRVKPTATATKRAATPTPVFIAPVRLTISDPNLKIDAKVIPMSWQVVDTKQGPRSEWVIPKNEAGHHINSAGLGEAGNLVISGHNNIYGRIFLRISQAWDNTTRVKVDDFTDRSALLKGRTIQLYDAAGKRYEYVVTDFLRVRDTGVSQQQRITNGRFMLPTTTAQLTIITCWPPTNNTHRLVVIAEPAQ